MVASEVHLIARDVSHFVSLFRLRLICFRGEREIKMTQMVERTKWLNTYTIIEGEAGRLRLAAMCCL